jgi:hypothetical protein
LHYFARDDAVVLRELYDHETDPPETLNLAPHPDRFCSDREPFTLSAKSLYDPLLVAVVFELWQG